MMTARQAAARRLDNALENHLDAECVAPHGGFTRLQIWNSTGYMEGLVKASRELRAARLSYREACKE